jgi:septal ring factor EnvC (AmiA/AmiB activator)
MKRCFDRQDEVIQEFITKTYDEHATIIIGVVRELIDEQNTKIFKKIDEQNKVIKRIQDIITNIQIELKEHDTRIKKLEARMQKLLAEHDNNHN